MEKIELRAAQRFIDRGCRPPDTPKYPPKAWCMLLGTFDLPDEELDAKRVICSPPHSTTWPYDNVAFRIYHPNGDESDHYCVKTVDGSWLELVDPEIAPAE